MYRDVIEFIRSLYSGTHPIHLHEPILGATDQAYVTRSIESGFVSSIGAFVDQFEREFANYVGAEFGVATVNGTAAIHTALLVSGVEPGDEVLTQSLTFVATCNAIIYANARPVFIDVDEDTLGMSPDRLRDFLEKNARRDGDICRNRVTNAAIRACLPMHTFGHPCRILELRRICEDWGVSLVEDAAEAVGSRLDGAHLGTIGQTGTFSFNGNKIITCGGGGMMVTNDQEIARRAKHLTTTARLNAGWEFVHDTVGFNYRLPNLNAALGCAQLSRLDSFLQSKRDTAAKYRDFFESRTETFIDEPEKAESNFWLNSIALPGKAELDAFLEATNAAGIATRPIWRPMHKLPMFASMQRQDLTMTDHLSERIASLPSSVRPAI